MDPFNVENEDEYLTRVVIDVSTRTFRMYSNEGEVREIDCDTTEDFMNILAFIRDFQEVGLLDSDIVFYSEPAVTT